MSGILALDLARSTGWAAASDEAVASYPINMPFVRPDIAPQHLSYGTKLFSDAVVGGALFDSYSDWLADLIADFEPNALAYEVPFLKGQAATRLMMGLVGATERVAHVREVRCYEAQPATIKKHFTGNGRAKKEQVIDVCRQHGWAPDSHDAADALALLDYFIHCVRTNKP